MDTFQYRRKIVIGSSARKLIQAAGSSVCISEIHLLSLEKTANNLKGAASATRLLKDKFSSQGYD